MNRFQRLADRISFAFERGMSRSDRARWADASDWADLGDLVVAWLDGNITQTPGHCGPPDDETIPLIPVLTAVNRAGFITDNSQAGDDRWADCNAWVCGFAADDVLARLRESLAGTPLVLTACRGKDHGCRRSRIFRCCPWRESVADWAERCPHAADDLRNSWYVGIEDPERCRNDRLWPALAAFAGLVCAS